MVPFVKRQIVLYACVVFVLSTISVQGEVRRISRTLVTIRFIKSMMNTEFFTAHRAPLQDTRQEG